MSIYSYFLSGRILNKAKQLTFDARQESGEKSDLLFQQAYESFSTISESYSNYSDALYYWGFALLHQAQAKPSAEAITIFEEAINKFSFCKTIAPQHLGAAVDGGVAPGETVCTAIAEGIGTSIVDPFSAAWAS